MNDRANPALPAARGAEDPASYYALVWEHRGLSRFSTTCVAGEDRERGESSFVLWSTHPSYQHANAQAGRPSIGEALVLGPDALDSFEAGGGDLAKFKMIRAKRPRRDLLSVYERRLDFETGKWVQVPFQVSVTSRDQFEEVSFEKVGGFWTAKTREVPWEEAMAHAQIHRWYKSGIVKVTEQDGQLKLEQNTNENPWLDGPEVVDFLYVFNEVVLPEIKDAVQRAQLTAAVEKAVQEGGDIYGDLIGEIDEASNKAIRDIIERRAGEHAQKKRACYDELARLISVAKAIPSGAGARSGTPPVLLPFAVTSPRDLMRACHDLRAYLFSKGINNTDVETFISDRINPIDQRAIELYREDENLLPTANRFKHLPPGPIRLMAVGYRDTGGYLSQSGEVVVALPTDEDREQPGRMPKNYEIAREGDFSHLQLDRDWMAVLRHWEKTGIASKRPPRIVAGHRIGTLKMGASGVSVHAHADVADNVNYNGAERVVSVLQEAIGQIPNEKPFGRSYLEALRDLGVSGVILVSPEMLREVALSEAARLMREARTLLSKGEDVKQAIRLLRQAAVKLEGNPQGYYFSGGWILMRFDVGFNFDYVKGWKRTFLHELAHADEAVRRKRGLLPADLVAKIDAAQFEIMKKDRETVSDHTEVTSGSSSGPEERRADGLVEFWLDPENLKSVDPDLYVYFTTLTRHLETRQIRDQEGRRIRGDRLIIPNNPFKRGTGNLVSWVMEQAALQPSDLGCMIEAGLTSHWAISLPEGGCEVVPSRSPKRKVK